MLEDPVYAVDVTTPIPTPLSSPVLLGTLVVDSAPNNVDSLDSPFVSATQSELYESPASAGFYNALRVPETELESARAQTVDSPVVLATQSEAYESPASADFYDPLRVPEIKLEPITTPCFVSIAPLVITDWDAVGQDQWVQRTSRKESGPMSISDPTPMSDCGFDERDYSLFKLEL